MRVDVGTPIAARLRHPNRVAQIEAELVHHRVESLRVYRRPTYGQRRRQRALRGLAIAR